MSSFSHSQPITLGSCNYGIHPVIMGRTTFFIYSGHTYSESNGCWTMWNFVLFSKCFTWGSVFELQTFQSKQFYKMKKNHNLMHSKQRLLTWTNMKLLLVLSVLKIWISLSLPLKMTALMIYLFLKLKKRRQIHMICKEIYSGCRIQIMQCFFCHVILGYYYG